MESLEILSCILEQLFAAKPSSVECCPRGIGEAGDGVKLVRGSKLEGWILAEVGFTWPI